jgi:hypothetical protein
MTLARTQLDVELKHWGFGQANDAFDGMQLSAGTYQAKKPLGLGHLTRVAAATATGVS